MRPAGGPGGARGGGEGAERGLTLIELLVVMAVLGVVMGVAMQLLASLTSNAGRQDARLQNHDSVRAALLELRRDIRATDPLLPLPDVASFATALELTVGRADGTETYVRWWVDGDVLVRSELPGPGLDPTVSRPVLQGVEAGDLFTYIGADGEVIDWAQTADDFVHCAARVQVRLTAGPVPASAPVTETVTVAMRTRSTLGLGCSEEA